jgi:hypothetical protein
VLWGPDWFVGGLGLEAFIDSYRMYLGVVFLILLAATLPTPIHCLARHFINKFRANRELKRWQARLHDLSREEKDVLRHYVQNDTRTHTLDATDGIAVALESAKIIYRASNMAQEYTDFAYVIQQWALDYLRKNPGLLKQS